MHKNRGYYLEEQFVDALNGKKLEDLNTNLQFNMKEMFGVIHNDTTFKSEKIYGFVKPDISIECNGVKHYVSLKTGRSTTVHQEQIKSFILYLREKGISTQTQKTILKYHYGDGTLTGTGVKRYSHEDLNFYMKKEIAAANEELNANVDLVTQVVERCVFVGNIDPDKPADYVYHGDLRYGVLCNRKQIIRHLRHKGFDYIRCLHIGPLMIRPHARYADKEIKNEDSRNRVDLQWLNFFEDLKYISERYDG